MSAETPTGLTSRRGFIKALAATAAAAAATGGGAAFWLNREPVTPIIAAVSDTPVSIVTHSVVPTLPAVAAAPAANVNQLVQALAAAESDNSRLQNLLDAAQARIAELEGGLDARASEGESLRAQLASTENRLGLLAGLVALYERLDDADIVAGVRSGIASVGSALGELADNVPSVAETLEDGRRALQTLDAEIPLVNGARYWLLLQLYRLQAGYGALEQMLAAVADNVGPLLTMLADWAQKVIRWLPFGLGRKTADVIGALEQLLAELPATIDGGQQEVAAPLELWLGRADDETVPLRERLIKPLQERTLSAAQQHLDKASALRGRYQEQLAQPASVALDRQQALRAEITAYKAQHQL